MQSWAFEPAQPTRRHAARGATSGDGPVVVPVRGPLRASNSEVVREAVLGGLGIGLLPDFSASEHLAAGELVQLLRDWAPRGFFGEQIFAIRPWAPQVPRAVRCLVDHLRQTLASGFGAPG